MPLSTNLPPRPKGEILAKHAPVKRPASPPRKAASSAPAKPHPLPPPPIVQEPVSGGEQYATGAFLGKGGFAICFEGKLARNDRVFALKVVKSEMPQKKMAEKVFPPYPTLPYTISRETRKPFGPVNAHA